MHDAGRAPAWSGLRTRASARTQKRPGFERKLAYRYFTWKDARAGTESQRASPTAVYIHGF
jgi:hypothetical protein